MGTEIIDKNQIVDESGYPHKMDEVRAFTAVINGPWPNRWDALCKFINVRPNGAVIYRKALMEYMRPGRDFSIDTYRNYLTKAGFLVIIGNGKYEKVKSIPKGISRRDVQRLGYDVSNYHKGW